MSNYSLVVNSTFQPFTYQELAAPLDRQELYHEKLAEEYDKLSSQADVLEAMGANDRDKNSGTYAKYKAYSDALRKEADNLYQFGLNTESRQRLSDLRRRYNTDIVPIQNAWTKRREEAAMQMQAQIQHPELRFTRDAANTSLDEYILNPEGGFGVVNLNTIAAQMSAAAKNLAKQAREGRLEGIDEYTSRYITPYGLDPNLIRNWQNDPSKSPTLTNMMQGILKTNGITDENFLNTPNGKKIMQEAIGAAQSGAWSAVGEDKEHIVENFENRLYAQMQKEAAVARAKAGGSSFPKLRATNIGTETSDAYQAKGLGILNSLKGGNDGLKSSYFGRNAGQVNAMAIYKEYQDELKKNTKKKEITYNVDGREMRQMVTVPDEEKARSIILSKYGKYGVTDILSDDQYNTLEGLGYNSTDNNPSAGKARHSTMLKKFNNLVETKSAYDIPMADGAYKEMDNSLRASLIQNKDSLKSKVFEYKGYKRGKGVSSLSDIGINEDDPDKSAKILTIGYDPNNKGFIRVTFNNGKVFLMTPGLVGGLGMYYQLKDYEENPYINSVTGESRLLNAKEITSGLARNINWYNPGAQSTSNDAF